MFKGNKYLFPTHKVSKGETFPVRFCLLALHHILPQKGGAIWLAGV